MLVSLGTDVLRFGCSPTDKVAHSGEPGNGPASFGYDCYWMSSGRQPGARLEGLGKNDVVDGARSQRRDAVPKTYLRFWRTIKYEEVYLHAYDTVDEARQSISRYLDFYNARRPHMALDQRTPDQAYFNSPPLRRAA